MSNIPTPGQVYRHFKGNLYRIVTLAEHSETKETLVVYQALYGEYKVYARPLSMFQEKIDREKYPDAVCGLRFELQKELIAAPAPHNPAFGNPVPENSAFPKSLSEPEKEEEKKEGEKEAEGKKTGEKDSPGTDFPEAEEQQEKLNIDPLVLDFLDARTYRERLNILSALHPRITDDMINIMAISVDVEIEDGETERRFEELRTCLLTFERYESKRNRLR